MGKISLFGKTVAWGEDARPMKAASGYRTARRYWGMEPFGGEKNLGELGPVKDYFLDNQLLRARSWQMFLESKVCQMGIKRLGRWVVGSGLTLQANPETAMLATEGVALEGEKFNEVVESRWEVWANSVLSDYAGMRSLHQQGYSAFINMLVGGDVLVICRIVKGMPRVQLIDGCHVCNPMDLQYSPTGDVLYEGNIIRDGVEMDSDGEVLAYHVKYSPMEWRRVEARNRKTGQVMAWLGSMDEFRLDDARGMGVLASVLETAAVLDRYQEATVGAVEELANVVMFAQHELNADGTNPWAKGLAKIKDFNAGDDVPVDVNGTQLASNVYASTKKQLFNMPPGSKLATVDAQQPSYFKEFYETVSDDIFSTIGIPPDVARMIYNNSFSASRAALKDWEHTLETLRARFCRVFYGPIYALWLDTEVLRNKVQAPGYLQALMRGDELVLAAYRNAGWSGANVPHIDPEKEVRAERLKLGPAFDNQPLTTMEAATRVLNGGDAQANQEQGKKELGRGKEFDEHVVSSMQPAGADKGQPAGAGGSEAARREIPNNK